MVNPQKIMTAMKNMMRLLCMAVLAMAVAALAGCQKEEPIIGGGDGVHFTTTVKMAGGGTKALDASGHKTFAVGDKIAVVYTNTSGNTVKAESAPLTADDIQNSGKAANFSVELENPDTGEDVTYIYPASMAKSDGTVNYSALANQNGKLATLAKNLDLCTHTGSWSGSSLPSNVQLVNQLAICKLTIKNGETTLNSSIRTLYIGDGTNGYYITDNNNGLSNPVWVAMRPVSSSQWLTFHAYKDASNKYEKELTGNTLAAGNIYPVNVGTEKLYQGTLFGTFTVNAGGSKVRFSRSNLYVRHPDMPNTFLWAFYNNQFDYIGNESGSGNNSYTDPGTTSYQTYFDLFGWSTDTPSIYFGISHSENNASYCVYLRDHFLDWGNENYINSGGNQISQWRTLSKDEFVYLLTHSGATIGGTANACYAKGQLNGVTGVNSSHGPIHGIFLFPDHYTHPNDVAVPLGINAGNSDIGWEGNIYSSTDWRKMEMAGAVFLPAAGTRSGRIVTEEGGSCYYWTSSIAADNSTAHYIKVTSSELDMNATQYFYKGSAVRLVKNAN